MNKISSREKLDHTLWVYASLAWVANGLPLFNIWVDFSGMKLSNIMEKFLKSYQDLRQPVLSFVEKFSDGHVVWKDDLFIILLIFWAIWGRAKIHIEKGRAVVDGEEIKNRFLRYVNEIFLRFLATPLAWLMAFITIFMLPGVSYIAPFIVLLVVAKAMVWVILPSRRKYKDMKRWLSNKQVETLRMNILMGIVGWGSIAVIPVFIVLNGYRG